MSTQRPTIIRTDAVVLRSVDYGETSRIVTLFTRDRGPIGVMARGARSVRSRFGATLEPMAYVQVVVHMRPNRDLQTLSEASHLRIFPRLGKSLDRLEAAMRAVELTRALVQAEQATPVALDLLVETLTVLDVAEDRALNAWPWFALRLASILGLAPLLDRESVQALEAPEGWLQLDRGQVSTEHGPREAVRAGRTALRAFAVFARSDLRTVLRMNVTPGLRHEVEGLVDAFLKYHVEDAYPERAARIFEQLHDR